MVAISANDVTTHPDDRPERMAEDARRYAYPFPYLYDEPQAVARAYQAACTPDFFLFDGEHRLAYRGQFDGSRPGNGRTGHRGRSSRGGGRGPGWQARAGRAEGEHGLRHQVEAGVTSPLDPAPPCGAGGIG